MASLGAGALALGAACGISLESGVGGTGGAGGEVGSSSVASSGVLSSTGTGALGGGGGASPDGGVMGAGLAAACVTDAECGPGLACLLDTVNDPIFGGGPPNGFCTRACAGDIDCPEPGGVCLSLGPDQTGRCTLSCTVGPPIDMITDFYAPLDPSKCHGREDLRCGKAKDGVGVCLPTCGLDAQCAGGRVCDPRLAVCVDHANDGLPLGAVCDPTASPDPCGGRCVGFDTGIAMCSSPCVVGGDAISTADCGGPERGFCAFRAQPSGPGDTGYCTPACLAQSDCAAPSFWCFDLAGVSDQVHRGYCFAAAPCPGGQPDCIAAGDQNFLCTDTPYGPFCLDPAYPVGAGGAPP